jgi:hypothetical protein
MLERTAETAIPITAVPYVGFRCVSSEVKDLTEDEVREFRTYEATATERELKNGRVDHLREKVEKGLAVTFHWVTAAIKELEGQVRRLNGQHSSIMLQKLIAAGRFPKGLKVHREHFEVDDGNALTLLFRQFDDRASSRSPLDISGVYQGLHPQLASVPRKIGKLAIDGYTFYQVNVEKVPGMPRGDDAYSAFNDPGLYPYILWLRDLFAVKSKEMQYPAIVAAIVGTYMTNEGAARAFWEDVVSLANGEDEKTPQTVLSDWLIDIRAEKIDRPDPVNLYQGCIYAWNAYRDGKAITAIRDDIKKNFFTIHE